MRIDAAERQRAIEAVAGRLNEIAPDEVVRVYAGFQAPKSDGEHYGAIIGVADLGDRWGFGQFDQDPVAYELVEKFWLACGDQKWTTCEVTVDYDGEFSVDLGYDPLPAGEDIDPRMIKRLQEYRASWVAEHGRTPRG